MWAPGRGVRQPPRFPALCRGGLTTPLRALALATYHTLSSALAPALTPLTPPPPVKVLSGGEEAVRSFQGAVIAVSHDRYFLRQIATRILQVEGGQFVDFQVGGARRGCGGAAARGGVRGRGGGWYSWGLVWPGRVAWFWMKGWGNSAPAISTHHPLHQHPPTHVPPKEPPNRSSPPLKAPHIPHPTSSPPPGRL